MSTADPPDGPQKEPTQPPEHAPEPQLKRVPAPHPVDERPGVLEAKLRIEEKRIDAKIRDREERTKALNTDQARRTGAEMSGLELWSQTTQVERYFCMAVIAAGVLAAIALALITAGQGTWEYRLSPATGLLISGGGSLRLRSIARPPIGQQQA